MRNFLRKWIPNYARLPMILCWAVQLGAYFLTKLIPHGAYIQVTLPVDREIPLVPAWILAYVGAYLYWILGYVLIFRISRAHCRVCARADIFSKLVCLVFFVLMPTRMDRPSVIGGGLLNWLVRFIYACDSPTNLFPSMHCLVSWLLARELMRIKAYPAYVRWGAVVFSVLVFLSTLFTRQHVVIDIFGGMALAEISMLLSRLWERRLRRGEKLS